MKVQGKSPRKVKRGTWVRLKIRVTNRGTKRTSKRVKIKVSGKGVALKRRSYTIKRLGAGKSKRVTVRAKLTKGTRRKVTVKVSAGRQRARSAVTLTTKKPSKNGDARAGSYAGDDADESLRFTVTKDGYVTGFRLTLSTRCGGYPNPFTYHWAWYNHPKTKIGANGKVDGREDGGTYVSELTMTFSGSRATGTFTYWGPNRCYASTDFTAVRG